MLDGFTAGRYLPAAKLVGGDTTGESSRALLRARAVSGTRSDMIV